MSVDVVTHYDPNCSNDEADTFLRACKQLIVELCAFPLTEVPSQGIRKLVHTMTAAKQFPAVLALISVFLTTAVVAVKTPVDGIGFSGTAMMLP